MADHGALTRIGKQDVDGSAISIKVEHGNTQLLEDVLGKTDTIAEREAVFKLVAQANQDRRSKDPGYPMTEIDFDSHAEGDREVLSLKTKYADYPQHTAYEEFDMHGKDGKEYRHPTVVGVHDDDAGSGDPNALIYFGLQLYMELNRS